MGTMCDDDVVWLLHSANGPSVRTMLTRLDIMRLDGPEVFSCCLVFNRSCGGLAHQSGTLFRQSSKCTQRCC